MDVHISTPPSPRYVVSTEREHAVVLLTQAIIAEQMLRNRNEWDINRPDVSLKVWDVTPKEILPFVHTGLTAFSPDELGVYAARALDTIMLRRAGAVRITVRYLCHRPVSFILKHDWMLITHMKATCLRMFGIDQAAAPRFQLRAASVQGVLGENIVAKTLADGTELELEWRPDFKNIPFSTDTTPLVDIE